MGENLAGASLLHHLAQIHNRDVIGNVLHNGQVMGDKQIGKVPLLLKFHHQVQNLSLNRNIQCGDRLIAHHQLRVQNQRPGNADTLTAAAVQLVGVQGVRPLRKAHNIHDLMNLFLPLRL